MFIANEGLFTGASATKKIFQVSRFFNFSTPNDDVAFVIGFDVLQESAPGQKNQNGSQHCET